MKLSLDKVIIQKQILDGKIFMRFVKNIEFY